MILSAVFAIYMASEIHQGEGHFMPCWSIPSSHHDFGHRRAFYQVQEISHEISIHQGEFPGLLVRAGLREPAQGTVFLGKMAEPVGVLDSSVRKDPSLRKLSIGAGGDRVAPGLRGSKNDQHRTGKFAEWCLREGAQRLDGRDP